MINKRIKQFFYDMATSININIKLLKSSRAVIGAMLFAIIIFSIMVGTLSSEVEERSNIPIGIVDYDNSKLSGKLVNNLKSADFVLVYEGTKEELEKRLEERTISGYFAIKKGYEKKVTKGQTSHLLDMYYKSENGVFSMVSDVIAGEMIDDICAGKTWAYYERLREQYPELENSELFFQYVENARKEKGKNLLFDIQLVDVKNSTDVTEQMDNSILYKQIIVGIVSILFGFLTMIMVGTLKNADDSAVRKRRKVSGTSEFAFGGGQVISIFITLMVLGIISSVFILGLLGKRKYGESFQYLFMVVGAFLKLIGLQTVLFYLVGKVTEDKVTYPLIGTFIVMITGAVGVIGFFDATLLNISKLMPNYWFIIKITDIMVSG